MVKSRSSSDGEEEVLIVSSGEEEDNEHTIFSSEEDEPEDPPPRSFKKKEACGSGEAQPVKSGTKRPSEGTSKRAKKISTVGEKKMGANLFKRLFSEEDEIVLLQGMFDSKTDKGNNPLEDQHGFFESIKDSISFEVTWGQFKDKIRSMKRKHMRKEKRGASSSNAHEQKCFELSKVIWGAEGIAVECTIKSNGESRKSERIKTKELNCSKGGDEEVSPLGVTESDWFENSFLVPSIEILGVDSVKQLWSKVPIETKKKTEEKMKLLHANELECKKVEETLKTMKDQCVLQRLALLREVTSLITEAN